MTTTTINLKPANFGSVSEGTLNTGDLLEAFANELEWHFNRNSAFYASALPENRRAARRIIRVLGKASGMLDSTGDYDDYDADFLVEEIGEELQDFAPAYGYFGANPGDGADFGFWLDEDALEAGFDGLRVDDLSKVPEVYQGEVMVVNDHGNRTIYAANNGDLREVWSIV
jgi:hypothetical protein